jgi:LPS sulfotransferase NodH
VTVPQFHSFVVLAEMRTGSNFLESNLNAIPGLHCHGEAFNPYFIGGEDKEELLGVTLAERGANPARLIKAMRDGTPGLSGFRYFHDHDPRVFDLVMDDPGCAKIILTRNALESYISWKIAKESDQWWLANTKHLKTVRPTFDAAQFEARTAELQDYQIKLMAKLQKTGQTAFYLDYEDILDLDVLNGIAAFLGVEGRLKSLVFRFKKQNPEAIRDKVANPEEMDAALARIDWFGVHATPNFEPRRSGAVPQYVASAKAPLLFLPIKAGPEARVTDWLASYGRLIGDFDRQSLRKWKQAHPGQRSFAVLRHPVSRAYSAYCDFLAREWMPELRPYLKRVHRFELPPRGKGFATIEEHRAGFLVFLDFIGFLLEGRTELKTPAQFATLGATVAGFAQVQSPDLLIREDRLEQGLAHLAAETGIAFNPLPADPETHPWPLAELYDTDIETKAREAYWRDYNGFGFRAWAG